MHGREQLEAEETFVVSGPEQRPLLLGWKERAALETSTGTAERTRGTPTGTIRVSRASADS